MKTRSCSASILMTDQALPAPVCQDRKSTRLNSSHSQISYAVFCLKKKKSIYLSDHTLTRISSDLTQLTDPPPLDITADLAGTAVRGSGIVRELRLVVKRSDHIIP